MAKTILRTRRASYLRLDNSTWLVAFIGMSTQEIATVLAQIQTYYSTTMNCEATEGREIKCHYVGEGRGDDGHLGTAAYTSVYMLTRLLPISSSIRDFITKCINIISMADLLEPPKVIIPVVTEIPILVGNTSTTIRVTNSALTPFSLEILGDTDDSNPMNLNASAAAAKITLQLSLTDGYSKDAMLAELNNLNGFDCLSWEITGDDFEETTVDTVPVILGTPPAQILPAREEQPPTIYPVDTILNIVANGKVMTIVVHNASLTPYKFIAYGDPYNVERFRAVKDSENTIHLHFSQTALNTKIRVLKALNDLELPLVSYTVTGDDFTNIDIAYDEILLEETVIQPGIEVPGESGHVFIIPKITYIHLKYGIRVMTIIITNSSLEDYTMTILGDPDPGDDVDFGASINEEDLITLQLTQSHHAKAEIKDALDNLNLPNVEFAVVGDELTVADVRNNPMAENVPIGPGTLIVSGPPVTPSRSFITITINGKTMVICVDNYTPISYTMTVLGDPDNTAELAATISETAITLQLDQDKPLKADVQTALNHLFVPGLKFTVSGDDFTAADVGSGDVFVTDGPIAGGVIQDGTGAGPLPGPGPTPGFTITATTTVIPVTLNNKTKNFTIVNDSFKDYTLEVKGDTVGDKTFSVTLTGTKILMQLERNDEKLTNMFLGTQLNGLGIPNLIFTVDGADWTADDVGVSDNVLSPGANIGGATENAEIENPDGTITAITRFEMVFGETTMTVMARNKTQTRYRFKVVGPSRYGVTSTKATYDEAENNNILLQLYLPAGSGDVISARDVGNALAAMTPAIDGLDFTVSCESGSPGYSVTDITGPAELMGTKILKAGSIKPSSEDTSVDKT